MEDAVDATSAVAAPLDAKEDDEHDSKEMVLLRYFLQEWELIKSLLDRIVSNGSVSDPSDVHKIRSIMDKYQEQGQLLEPYLESIVSPLMILVRLKTMQLGAASDELLEIIKPLCIIIYSLVTVCGYKSVIKFFPHQVSDLEPAVALLEKCHQTKSATSLRQESTGEMETKCVVLLWLYILVLIPFDITSVDTSIANSNYLAGSEPSPLVTRILEICKDYLSSAGPMRRISGLLLARLLTRPDMPKAFNSFTEWAHEVLLSVTDDVVDHFRLLGVVEALASIFKVGSRKILLNVVSTTWNDSSLLMKSTTATRSSLLRKFLVKLSQRVGLTCLPHRSPTWRYRGKSSSLGENLLLDAAGRSSSTNCGHHPDNCNNTQNAICLEEEDMDVPEIVEEIIELLLSGLRDSDTVVRWSAAKGIGRITARLTSSLSEEVLSSILELFSPGEGDGSWHGGCLALAELARRGLLLPVSLPKVVPVITKALHYDIRRGSHSIGSHVRDAAAYVCWAFGRAYSSSDMKDILEQLSPHLLIVACYDREVNCRRAASAAFQENVGRQGTFPYGIDIVNTADYFSLASRASSYLRVAVCIAQYNDYLCSFVEELLCNKITHWDKSLRELAAEALSALAKYDHEYFAGYVLEKLIPSTLSLDLCTRHGATLAGAVCFPVGGIFPVGRAADIRRRYLPFELWPLPEAFRSPRMDGNSCWLGQGEASAADAVSGDWRTELQHESRQRIVNKIMDNLKRYLPISVPEGLKELKKIAVQFEEKIYNAATSQADYLKRIALKLLSMEAKTQHTPINPSMVNTAIPNQNPTVPVSIGKQGQSLVTPMVNLPAARQQLQPQNFQNNTSAAVQSSANLPSALSSVTGHSQSNISSAVGQTSNLQNMPDISQNSVSNSVGQGAPPDIYANAQWQMQERQQQQQIISQRQQQSQNQLICQHQLQRQLLKQKLQHSSLMQQQSLLQPTRLQSSQQSVMQMSSGLQSGQCSIQQTQPMTMQSAAQPDFQQNQLNPVQQSVPSLLQQHPQSVARQQAPLSMHQQTPSLQQQPSPVPQQSNLSLQQQQRQQTNISNMQQAQLLGQQNHVPDMQQQQQLQRRLPVQQNSLLGMQQPQQMLNQQNISLNQQQQLGYKSNISRVQQHQQEQLPGSLPNVSNMQVHQHSMHILQQPKTLTQEQQENQQTSLALLQPQGQQSQHQSTQQQIISQFQSQPAQLQQQLAMQQRPNPLQRQMQQRLQASCALLQSQNAIEPQKQFVQVQRVLPEVSSSTSVDSTAQIGHAGVDSTAQTGHAGVDSTAQTGHAGVADLQEEIYQKIKSMREMYFADLNELDQKITLELQQHDALIPPAKQPEQHEKLKRFKIMLEWISMILQISKNNIHTGLKEKLPMYEKVIVNVLASNKKKIIPSQPQGQQQFQHPGGLAHSSQVSQLQQHDNHMNQVQHMNLQGSATSMQPAAVTGMQHVSTPLPTHFGVPTTWQNITNASQPGSISDSAQGSSFSSLQQGAMGSKPQGGGGSVPSTINAPQRINANALSNSSMNPLQPNAILMQPSSNTLPQQHFKQQQQEQQQQLMQTQQMKQQSQQHHLQQQVLQQQQKQQLMQLQPSLEQQLHHQEKQQPAQMLAHQMPQLHQTNEVNESKVRPGLGIKPGLNQQCYSAGQHHGYYHQQLKPSASGASWPISLPQNLQVLSPQNSHHASPQADQCSLLSSQVKGGTPLQSAGSPFVPSPCTPMAPSPVPVDSEKHLSGISPLTNAGHVGHQQSALAPPQALAVGIPGISASSILEESSSPDGNQANASSKAPDKMSTSEWPLERLIKVVKSSSPKALSSAIRDIGHVVSMTDRIAGSAPGNGSRAAVGEDLVAMTKCHQQARKFMSQDGISTAKKIKRNTNSMPLNNMSSAGSVNDSTKQSFGFDTSEFESTATSHVKRQKIEVNHTLLEEEIREINQQLIITTVNISKEDADSVAAASDGEGTVIKCSFTAVALSPSLKSQCASLHMSPILPLRLFVPANYPKCSPVLLDKLPDESSGESDDLSVKAKSRFGISLRGLSQPMSLREMARTWDACVHKVIAEYAQQTGGGSLSSRYGVWENCVGS